MKSGLLLSATVLVAIALITGATYEQAERARDRDRLPQIGRSVDIGGRALNIDCAGSGTPAVIFESGAPRPGYSWVYIQREVARFTQACWYDRAGFGWSDLGPYPRTSLASARDLHALLARAAIRPPYVLVSESSAALDTRVYTGLFPEQVAGVVMVDAIHPDLFIRMPQIRGKAAPVAKYVGYPQSVVSQGASGIGLLRLLSRPRPLGPVPPGLTPEEWTTIWRLTYRPQARVALMQEFPATDQSIAQARSAGDLGNRPLRVVSGEPAGAPSRDDDIGMQLQADLVRLSTRGKQVIVHSPGAGLLQYQAPDAIINATRDIVQELRQTRQ
jgi:pimeloyl-ACP methyl ester carboxylesterase